MADKGWKIGVTQWMLPCAPEECVAAAAELGLAAVQVDLGSAAKGYPLTNEAMQRKLTADAERTGVEIASVVLNDLCANGFVHEEGSEKTETAYRTMALGIETAAKMGVRSVCMPSFFDNELREGERWERTVRALRHIVDLGDAAGVTVYTENVLDPAALLRLFRDVDRPSLRLLFDSQNYHQMVDGDAAAAFLAARERVGDFLHVKDGTVGLGDARLGEGSSGFLTTLRTIVESGFRGVYILENRYETMDAAREEIARLGEMLDACAKG